ncbi:MAG: fructosamine kinase family protein [Rhodothermales bacterium]
MSLPDALIDTLTAITGPLRATHPVGGGCIAQATFLEAERGDFFLKWGQSPVGDTFAAEAAGLNALAGAGSSLVVPSVVGIGSPLASLPGFLLLDWLVEGPSGRTASTALGRGLAEMHRATADRYGFDSDNFIGRLPQSNGWMARWPDFFRERRLAPQVAMARENGRWQSAWNAPLNSLYSRIDDLIPAHPPASLVHGDLWQGNALALADGRAALIDPAVYFGHREVDLAMSELFGRFDPGFYAAYAEAWPLEAGYPERRDLYNLYHLINHLNLFGGGYAGSVAAILRRFS